MPQRKAGPRLYYDRTRKQWAIRDGSRFVRTGCALADTGEAEKRLLEYIGAKHRPQPSQNPLVADMLIAYGNEHVPGKSSAKNIAYTISNLVPFWGDKRLADITANNCRSYAKDTTPAAGRRDLETLRAAIGHWHREYGPLSSIPAVVLPEKAEARDRWLSRSEAARLLWAARRTPHLRRFILIGLYTGSRSGAILAAQWSWVDLTQGLMRRRAHGRAETKNKRTPPVRLASRFLAHLRRWHRLDKGKGYIINYDGLPVKKLRRSWDSARKRADLPDVSPHTLRHTRATWLMQAKVDPWEAAGSLGMSLEMLTRTYGHHHPDWQKAASEV